MVIRARYLASCYMTGGFLFDSAPGSTKFKVRMERSLYMDSGSSGSLISHQRNNLTFLMTYSCSFLLECVT